MQFLLVTLFLISSIPAHAKELKEGEGIVIVNLEAENILGMSFMSLESKKRFKAKAGYKNRRTVKAGEYYLERFDTIAGNIRPIKMNRPTTDVGKFIIKSNAVTYLGDWKAGAELGRPPKHYSKVEYNLESINEYLEKYPYLKEYDLLIATHVGTVKKLRWDELK